MAARQMQPRPRKSAEIEHRQPKKEKIMSLRKTALALALITTTPFISSATENGPEYRQAPPAHDTILVDDITSSVNAKAHTNLEMEHPRQPTTRDNREISDDER
jgi:hypothetical protein